MGNPLGSFIRAKRDSIQPVDLGLPRHPRGRSRGLRRVDLATRAGISVEYLARIEQGRDRNPSPEVVNSIADGLCLDASERNHLRYLVKISVGRCSVRVQPVPPSRHVRPTPLRALEQLEPGIAVIQNRVGDLLAHTSGFWAITVDSGLLDHPEPNVNRYLFTDPRARAFFTDWEQVADEFAFDLWRAPSLENLEWITSEIAPVAGAEFTDRLALHTVPSHGVLKLDHPDGHQLRLLRESFEMPVDDQQLVVWLPKDEETTQAIDALQRRRRLRAAETFGIDNEGNGTRTSEVS